jgi:hypothetical protein
MPEPFWIDPFEVKLISPTNPLAKDVLGVQARQPRKYPMRFGGTRLGGETIEGPYLYPRPISASAE